ncbi:unnamed protein product [Prunus armeniaca]
MRVQPHCIAKIHVVYLKEVDLLAPILDINILAPSVGIDLNLASLLVPLAPLSIKPRRLFSPLHSVILSEASLGTQHHTSMWNPLEGNVQLMRIFKLKWCDFVLILPK